MSERTSDKWRELFNWLASKPSYINDQVYGLDQLFYGNGDDTFNLDGNTIIVDCPKTKGAAVEIRYGMGGVTFEPYTASADCKFIDHRDTDFPEVAEQWVATMKTLNSDDLITKIRARIEDEIKYRADELEAKRQKRIDEEKARLKRQLAKLENSAE